MYTKHFGLSAEAFSLTPDPAFLYLSPGHAEALAGLKIGLQSRRGLLVMIGEVGTGKTTLLYSLLSSLRTDIHTAYISNPTLPFEDMLRQALADFQVACDSRDRLEILRALNAFLLRCADEGSTAALVIDEAQTLDAHAFECLRLLSNFESFTAKLLQIVLVGQPELDTKLRAASLRQVTERVAVRCHINPLTRVESCKYIAHRLECVGGSLDVLTRGALRLIVRHSQGIPRRINILCHNAFLFAYGRGARRVSTAHVRAAVREWQGKGLRAVGGRRAPIHRAGQGRWWIWRPALMTAAAMLAAGAVAAVRWNEDPATAPAAVTAPAAENGDSGAQAPPEAPTTEAQDAAVPGSLPLSSDPAPIAPVLMEAALTLQVDPAPGASIDFRAEQPGAEPVTDVRLVPVVPGDTLVSLARQAYGRITPNVVGLIKRANPQIVDTNRILAGDTLRFPVAHTPADGSTTPDHE